ncbi:MAG: tRNA (adenosine(37)-N6)-threonylcarbamoyltransferase complex ATPase subunit type 1 TsaE [Patescibacteria group bacterium]|nr:tRNA (adenosine(37)-N6)-threonylcarbamoyltransferase complex ATPase subunit type 1 TsaE [Patescibacteria group bacterium]
MNGKIFVTNSFEETQSLGKELASMLKGGKIIALYGNLGAGKTTFVQGLAMGLGIKKRIISPTFIMVRAYEINNQKSIIKNQELRQKTFYHIDLYRTETADDIRGLGIDEIIGNNNNIVVIEWAEKIKDFLPKERIDIYFEYLGENRRRITIKYL